MRKYLLPSALILLLGLSFALAQTFTRAVQLSQDTSGAFSVDSNNGLYLPGHLLSVGTPAPTVTGNGTPSVVGTDLAGVAQLGANAATVTVAFGRAYLSTPTCVLSGPGATNISYALSVTGINVTSIQSSGRFNYICMSAS